ncbi:hypothetical protein [Rubripirellula reticaptiva]|nr:hypothetical protein [Rubripirellula reticaptiva]
MCPLSRSKKRNYHPSLETLEAQRLLAVSSLPPVADTYSRAGATAASGADPLDATKQPLRLPVGACIIEMRVRLSHQLAGR